MDQMDTKPASDSFADILKRDSAPRDLGKMSRISIGEEDLLANFDTFGKSPSILERMDSNESPSPILGQA